jgi:hypothetical protein
MKYFHLLLFFFICTFSVAQTVGRVEIQGNIKVPQGSDPQGINIYNKNSGRGSVSTEKGNFAIHVRGGDSLYFSALQFKDLLVVVEDEMVDSGILNIEVSEGINELPEVNVRQHNLTGNVDTDVKNIEVTAIDLPTMSASSINDYNWEFSPDGQTAVTNSAMNMGRGNGLEMGFQPLKIIGGIIGLVVRDRPKKEKDFVPNPIDKIDLERQIRTRYEDAFFNDVLGIPSEEIGFFLDFTLSQDIPNDLLKEEKEIDLIQLLLDRSREFKEL